MRIAKWVFTVALAMLLLIDGIVAFRLIRRGWPKRLVISAVIDQMAQIDTVPMHMNLSAWILFALYGAAHLILFYGVWRAWRSTTAHPSGTTRRA